MLGLSLTIFLSVLLIPVTIIVMFLTVWGAIDIYAMLRFRKSHDIDQTAIFGNWINLKWMFASRRKEMVEKHPWLGQDLSEVLGEKPDDGKVS